MNKLNYGWNSAYRVIFGFKFWQSAKEMAYECIVVVGFQTLNLSELNKLHFPWCI